MHPYELLSTDQVVRVHEASLAIMAEIGLDFRHPEALAVLAKGGAKVDGHRVLFPPKLVEAHRVKAPQRFEVTRDSAAHPRQV